MASIHSRDLDRIQPPELISEKKHLFAVFRAKAVTLILLQLLSCLGLAEQQPDIAWQVGGHRNTLEGLELSPSGQYLASCTPDQSIKVWDLQSGKIKSILSVNHTLNSGANSVAFSPDSNLIAFGGFLSGAVYRVSDQTKLCDLSGNTYVRDAAFSGDGSLTAIVSRNTNSTSASIDVYQVTDGNLLRHIQLPGDFWEYVALSPNSQRVAVADDDEVGVYSVQTGQLLFSISLSGVRVVEFSSDSSQIAIGGVGNNGYLLLLQAETGVQISSYGFPSAEAIDLAADWSSVLNYGFGTTRRYAIPSVQVMGTVTGSSFTRISHITGNRFVGGGSEGLVAEYDLTTGLKVADIGKIRQPVDGVALSPDGSILAIDNYRKVQFIDPQTGATLSEWPATASTLTSLAWAPDGSLIAYGGSSSVVVKDATTGLVVATLPESGSIGLEFDPSGSRLLVTRSTSASALYSVPGFTRLFGTAISDLPQRFNALGTLYGSSRPSFGNTRIYREADGTIAGTLSGGTCHAWSPDGRFVATGAPDRVYVNDAATLQLINELVEPLAYVTALSFSPDSETLVVVTNGELIRNVYFYRTSDFTVQHTVNAQHLNSAKSISFAPDSSRIYFGRYDGTVTAIFNPLSQNRVTGTISLGDFVGDPATRDIFVEVLQGSTVVQVHTVRPSTTGNFLVAGVPLGPISLRFKGSHWLSRVSQLTTVPGDVGTVELLNGDIDGDNEVGIGDYAVLSSAYGATEGALGWTPEADLNGDVAIDIADYAILSQNYGLIGE